MRAESLGAAWVYGLTHQSNTAARALQDKAACNLGFIHHRN